MHCGSDIFCVGSFLKALTCCNVLSGRFNRFNPSDVGVFDSGADYKEKFQHISTMDELFFKFHGDPILCPAYEMKCHCLLLSLG